MAKNPDDAYRAPDADLLRKGTPADSVETLAMAQNGVLAIVAAALASVIAVIAWDVLDRTWPLAAPAFFALSGVLVGIAMRRVGKGITAPFAFYAVAFHWLCVFQAIAVLQVRIVTPTPAVVLLGLVIAGSIAAAVLSRRTLSPDEKRALWRYAHDNPVPRPGLRNAWWVMLLVSALCAVLAVAVVASYRIATVLFAYDAPLGADPGRLVCINDHNFAGGSDPAALVCLRHGTNAA